MNKTVNRWFQLVLACIMLLFAGVIYAWSILSSPLASSLGFSRTELSFCFTLTLCFFCLGGLFSGLLSKRISVRNRLFLAAVLSGGGFVVTVLSQGSVLLLDLGYGVLAGCGIGFVYNTVISNTNAYFPDKKGLCSGILMMSFGFSSLLLGKLASALFEAQGFGWKKTYLLLGTLLAAVLCIGALLTKEAPKTPAKAVASSAVEIDTRSMIRRASFWKLFFFFMLLSAVGTAAIGFAKQLLLSNGVNEANAVTWAALISIFNGLGRIVAGILFDRLGMKKARLSTSFVVIAATGVTLLSLILKIPALSIAGLCLCGVSYGYSPTVSAAIVGDFYGMKHFGLNFPVLNLLLIPASFSSTLAALLVEAAGGSYVSTFVVLTALSLVGLVINITIHKDQN